MRLKDPSQKLSPDGGGASAEILDQVLGTADRKRTRSASSLDVKVANNGSLIRPPPSKKKNQKQQQQTYEQSGGKTTRARGGGGIPNTKFDFADLEGMTEEEIMQVLYDDPKLAAAATAAAEKMQKSEQKAKPPKPKSPSGRNNYKRSSSRTVSSHPDHLKAMMEEGVPVKQWIVLIVLLGVGLYQLRKAIVGSKKLAKPKRADKSPTKKISKKSTKKGAKTRLISAPVTPDKRMKDEQKLSIVQESVTEKVPVSTPKKNSKKKKTRKQKVAIIQSKNEDKKAPEVASHESPDSISTDGSSSVNDHHEVQPRSMPVSHENVIVEKSSHVSRTEGDDEGGEWCTVGATTRNATKPRSVEKEKQAEVGNTQSSSQEFKATVNKDQAPQVGRAAETPKLGNGKVLTGDGKPKIEKVNTIVDSENQLQDIKEDSSVNSAKSPPKALQDAKTDSSINSANSPSKALQDTKDKNSLNSAKKSQTSSDKSELKTLPQAREELSEDKENKVEKPFGIKKTDTADDEAIAKKLQLEEEKLAEHESVILAETEWEEVAIKKKKKGKS